MGAASLTKRRMLCLFFDFLLVAVGVAQQFTTITRFSASCDGSTLSVQCADPSHVIYVEDAYYGRMPDAEFCPTVRVPKSPCRSVPSLRVITAACQNENSCELGVNTRVMGNACPAIEKYAYIRYRCEPPGRSTIGGCPDNAWGDWVNVDKPNRGPGDVETRVKHRRTRQTCEDPFGVEFRVADTDESYHTSGYAVRVGRTFGLSCLNRDQQRRRRCPDFKVRYCCPRAPAPAGCPDLTPPVNGAIASQKKQGFVPGDLVSFRCEDGFLLRGRRTTRCSRARAWTNNPPLCIRRAVRTTCSFTGNIPNGRRTPPKPRFLAGQRVTFRCANGFNLVGKAVMNCGSGGWESTPPTCVKTEPTVKRPSGLTRCRGVGDPHYTTFDQKKFDFQGDCSYTFARYSGSEHEEFDIEVFNEHRFRKISVSWLDRTVMRIYGDVINLNPGLQIKVNGEVVNLPYTSLLEYTIERQGRFAVLKAANGLEVKVDGIHSIVVSVPSEYFGGKLEGLCGNFDGNPANDIVVDGAEDANAHGNRYLTPSKTDCIPAEDLKENECSKPTNMQRYSHDCAVITNTNGPFKSCHTIIKPDNYFSDCTFDVCVYGGEKLALELAVAAYAQACNEAGVGIEPWRDVTGTPLKCPPNSEYSICASLCPMTCVNTSPSCRKGCVEGCECSEGYILSGDRCVKTAECGCTFEGKYYLAGESFLQESCSKRCTCRFQRMSCVDTRCGKSETCGTDDKGRQACQLTADGTKDCVKIIIPDRGCWDIDGDGNAFQVKTRGQCSRYKERCCFRRGTCEACECPDPDAESQENLENTLLQETTDVISQSAAAGARSLMPLNPYLPSLPIQCIPPVPFPGNCKPQRNEPYVLKPPHDIPYCVRIPCKAGDNSKYDSNHRACGVQPGCYFDVPLFELRQAFGPKVLSGVPVCHLAIRSKAFHNHAEKVVAQFGAWNPYFTSCLLNEYDEEIRKGPVGCELIPVLETFRVTPKMAGWKSINSYGCALIDACWLPGRGCFYPVDISNVRVKSGERSIYAIQNEVAYGRPRCQTFDNSSPINALKSYHKCLRAGCSVDESITRMYYSHLFSIGEQLQPQNHWDYWDGVGKGLVGPFNIPDVLSEYGYEGGNGGKPISTTPAATTSFDPFAFPFDMPGPPSSSGQSFGPPPSSSGGSACGFEHKLYGGRPCAPKLYPIVKKKGACPYKPFFVPRFKKLEGSFDGCCDINLCYLPKKEISRMHSGAAHYYTEWTMFSPCSVTCGPDGVKKRYRKCVSEDRKLCIGNDVDEQPCVGTFRVCGQWSRWSRWTPCPRTCYPGGNQVRTRRCLPKGSKCDGHDEEARSCNEHGCSGSGSGSWTPWSDEPCSYLPSRKKCQTGKIRYCIYQGTFAGNCVGASTQSQTYPCTAC